MFNGFSFNYQFSLCILDIKVVCARDSVKVKWRVSSPFVPYAARLFLGSCMPSKWQLLPSGDGEAFFDYKFSECKFTKQVMI